MESVEGILKRVGKRARGEGKHGENQRPTPTNDAAEKAERGDASEGPEKRHQAISFLAKMR